jgi:hypothetical protein
MLGDGGTELPLDVYPRPDGVVYKYYTGEIALVKLELQVIQGGTLWQLFG